MNSAVSELVSSILKLDDIREEDASSLETLISAFSDDLHREVICPVSLVHELPLAKLVPSWARLQEMRYVCTLWTKKMRPLHIFACIFEML